MGTFFWPGRVNSRHRVCAIRSHAGAWDRDRVGSERLPLLGVLGLISRDIAMAAIVLTYLIVSVGCSMATEWFCRGQTVGKRLLHLRVADVQGLRLQFSQIAIRNLMRFVDSLPTFYLVGGIACLLSALI